MALIFCDGFDHYATADIPKKWDNENNEISISTEGRTGNCLKIIADDRYLDKTLSSTYQTICVGFAYKSGGLATADNDAILRLYEDSTLHIDIRQQDNTGFLYVTRNGIILGSTSEQVVVYNAWVHIQLKAYIHDTAGTIDLLINDVNVLNLSNIDTRNSANGVINRVQIYSATDGNCFDDFWIDDANLLGDCKVETLYPSGAGTTKQWDASEGDNYECVDEAVLNSDTDYVSTSTADEIDTYAFSNLTTTAGTVYGVQVNMIARKDDAGSRSIAPVVRPASTDRVGTTVSIGDSYMDYMQMYTVNPEDSAAWTIADVNNAEFGVKLIE